MDLSVPTESTEDSSGPVVSAALDPLAAELSRLRAGIRIMAWGALRDADAAEEVAQETIGRVMQALREERVRRPESLGAFARAIAHHVIVDTLRARRRIEPLGQNGAEALACEDDSLGSLISAEQATRVAVALERLSAGDREILRLSFFEGLTPQELAQRLREPGARVRKRKERALERLRAVLVGSGGHESSNPATQVTGTRSVVTRPRTPE
jgi:RNA polymerase sigma-70 factor (ECF subfamily)